MKFARINGVTLHYQLFGAGEGKPAMVFSNSLGTDFRIWRDIVGPLVKDFTILLYDKRGHGLSDIGAHPYCMADHVADIEGLIEHAGLRDVVMCGLSVGGMITQGLYAKRPDLIRAIILCDTACKIGNAQMWNPRIEAVEKGGVGAVAEMILERWFTAAFRRDDNQSYPGYRNMLVRTPREGYAGTCVALRDADYTAEAAKIAVPVLCVVGDQDGSTPPELVRHTASLIPGARFEVIANCGHIPCVERHAELLALIQSFIQEHHLGAH